MATVAEVIDNAVDFLDRADLAPVFIKKFPQLLRTVHSYEKYTHDLALFKLPDPVLVDQKLYVAPGDTPDIRDLLQVRAYTAYHNSVINSVSTVVGDNQVAWQFRDLSANNDKTDYFGYVYQHGWYRLGNNITVVGLDSTVKLVELEALVWPTWEYNALTEVYSTNSWILEKYPQLLQQHLIVIGARDSQNTAMLQSEREELSETINSFLNEFTGDICNGKSS